MSNKFSMTNIIMTKKLEIRYFSIKHLLEIITAISGIPPTKYYK